MEEKGSDDDDRIMWGRGLSVPNTLIFTSKGVIGTKELVDVVKIEIVAVAMVIERESYKGRDGSPVGRKQESRSTLRTTVSMT